MPAADFHRQVITRTGHTRNRAVASEKITSDSPNLFIQLKNSCYLLPNDANGII